MAFSDHKVDIRVAGQTIIDLNDLGFYYYYYYFSVHKVDIRVTGQTIIDL